MHSKSPQSAIAHRISILNADLQENLVLGFAIALEWVELDGYESKEDAERRANSGQRMSLIKLSRIPRGRAGESRCSIGHGAC